MVCGPGNGGTPSIVGLNEVWVPTDTIPLNVGEPGKGNLAVVAFISDLRPSGESTSGPVCYHGD